MKNSDPEPFEFSFSYSKSLHMSISTIVITMKTNTRTMEQPKNVQPRPKKPTRDQHLEDESPHYEPHQEHLSRRHRGDEQATRHEEAQTHYEVKSESHRSDKAQVQPYDLCRTGKWQETIEGQECQVDPKQQKANHKKSSTIMPPYRRSYS
jgi:hypothetical protein